jgi:type II secretory pathway component PulF
MVDVRKAVVDGANLSVGLAAQKIFPEMYTDMMSVGEQAGRFGATMHSIADIYERELDKQVQLVTTLIPPAILLVIATFIGVIVYAILSAIFGMTSNLHAAGR